MGDGDGTALLAGFRAGDEAATAALLPLLSAAIRSCLKKRWKSLKHAHADMQQRCLETLVAHRAAGLLRDGESITDLADRLVRASAVVEQRGEARDDKLAEGVAAEPRAAAPGPLEHAIDDELRQRMWELQADLDARHQRVLEAWAEAEKLGKRTVAEILEVSEDNAWKLVERAKRALGAAIVKAGYSAADFIEAGEDTHG